MEKKEMNYGEYNRTRGDIWKSDKYLDFLKEKKGLTLSERVKKELEGFDHRKEYVCDGTNGLSPQRHKVLVGKVSNLIADMTLAGASEDELIKVVKYSMVAIDALRYNLDYKKAADDLNYSKFYKKYSSFERRRRDDGNA